MVLLSIIFKIKPKEIRAKIITSPEGRVDSCHVYSPYNWFMQILHRSTVHTFHWRNSENPTENFSDPDERYRIGQTAGEGLWYSITGGHLPQKPQIDLLKVVYSNRSFPNLDGGPNSCCVMCPAAGECQNVFAATIKRFGHEEYLRPLDPQKKSLG